MNRPRHPDVPEDANWARDVLSGRIPFVAPVDPVTGLHDRAPWRAVDVLARTAPDDPNTHTVVREAIQRYGYEILVPLGALAVIFGDDVQDLMRRYLAAPLGYAPLVSDALDLVRHVDLDIVAELSLRMRADEFTTWIRNRTSDDAELIDRLEAALERGEASLRKALAMADVLLDVDSWRTDWDDARADLPDWRTTSLRVATRVPLVDRDIPFLVAHCRRRRVRGICVHAFEGEEAAFTGYTDDVRLWQLPLEADRGVSLLLLEPRSPRSAAAVRLLTMPDVLDGIIRAMVPVDATFDLPQRLSVRSESETTSLEIDGPRRMLWRIGGPDRYFVDRPFVVAIWDAERRRIAEAGWVAADDHP